MTMLQHMLLVFTVCTALDVAPLQALASANDPLTRSFATSINKTVNLRIVRSGRVGTRSFGQSIPSKEDKQLKPENQYNVNDAPQKHSLLRSDTAPLNGVYMSDKKAKVSADSTTVILPGLPSPLVAVVDSAEAAALTAKSSHDRKTVQSTMVDQVISDLRSVTPLTAGFEAHSPVSIAASISPEDGTGSTGLLLPFDQHVGAAAFRRANLLTVVFDSSKPVDLAPIADDPVFGSASYSLLSSGAVMTLLLGNGVHVEVLRRSEGWLIEIVKAAHETKMIQPEVGLDGITFPVAGPSHVVVVSDPVLKTDLLVGTVRQDHQNMPLSRHEPGFNLDDTLLGLVVERFADQLDMHVTSRSFVISESTRDPLVAGSAKSKTNMLFSRSLDLPPVGDAELERRYKMALAATAAAPVAERRLTRLNAAEAAMALGEGREAGELAAVADQDAPAGPQPGRAVFLRAIAAVLDHAPEAYSLLEDSRISTSDEVIMWRAIDLAQREPSNVDAARTLSRYLPLIESYPVHLRDQLLGSAAMSLASAGGPQTITQVQGLRGDGTVRLAQALVLQHKDENVKALVALDALAADSDPAVVFIAAEKAVGLRLKLGQTKLTHAADLLDAQTLNARMAGDELSLKLQVASLRKQDQNWSAALNTLHEIATSFPTASSQVAGMSEDILEQMVSTAPSANSTFSIAQLSMIESNLDLLKRDSGRTKISIELAQRFAELDLPNNAASLIEDALTHTSSDVERARLGVKLAQLRLDQGDVAGTLTALETTAAATLPAELSAARSFMQARADAAAGRIDAALVSLEPLHGPEVDDLRASELGMKHDWQGEAAALASLVALKVPANGPLSGSMEDLVLRLVAATARAGDRTALRQIEVRLGTRFKTQAKLDMLHLLTSDSVKTEGDLARSAIELLASQSALSALATAPTKNGS